MSKKLCAILALSVLTAVSSAAALADQCKLIVASRTSLDEAKQLTVEYSERFEDVELLQAVNGRYAISLGTLPNPSGTDMGFYIRTYGLPSDSFCMRIDSVSRYIAFNEVKQRPRTVAPTENSFGLSSCPRGYEPEGFPTESCNEIIIPTNAELDRTGNSWRCITRYIRRGDQCEFVVVPENAQLTPNLFTLPGSKGWACDRGFREVGDECERVFVPDNATLNPFSNGYLCNTGFADVGNHCREMTYEELISDLKMTEQYLMISRRTQKSCSQIVNLCEDTCDNDFTYSSSPSERECETVCEAIEDNC